MAFVNSKLETLSSMACRWTTLRVSCRRLLCKIKNSSRLWRDQSVCDCDHSLCEFHRKRKNSIGIFFSVQKVVCTISRSNPTEIVLNRRHRNKPADREENNVHKLTLIRLSFKSKPIQFTKVLSQQTRESFIRKPSANNSRIHSFAVSTNNL